MATNHQQARRRASPDGDPPGPPVSERKTRWPPWLSVAAATALVTLASGTLGLIYVIRPTLRPDPGEKQVAQATIVAIERGVSIADYAERIGREVPTGIGAPTDVGTGSRIVRCLPGDVYYVQQNLEGFKDRTTSIVLFTYRAKTKLRLRGAFPTVSGGSPAFNIKHSRTTDQSVVPVWAQWPYRPGRFFVRFELFHKKAFLSLVDAPPFRMTYERYRDFVQNCVNAKYP